MSAAEFARGRILRAPSFVRVGGETTSVTAGTIAARGLSRHAGIGARVEIETSCGLARGEIIRLDREHAIIRLFDSAHTAEIGAKVWMASRRRVVVGPTWKGRVLNALGEAIDGSPTPAAGRDDEASEVHILAAMQRARVDAPITSGIRVVDCFTPLCFGQRLGVFAGSGVGKSTLLAMLARCAGFDSIVVALVGERGREVREFMEGPLSAIRDRSVAIVATSDESAMMRRSASNAAMSAAEYFRDQGEKVLLIIDSVTRHAHALREVAISAGEPPVARGYPPSVFADIPQLLERAGPGREGSGSITAIVSVLVDGDDHNEPISDAVRGILDGHIVLDRKIAERGRFPAVDLLASVSRLAHLVHSPQDMETMRRTRTLVQRFEESEDLRAIGAYRAGADRDLDQAIGVIPFLYKALSQSQSDSDHEFGPAAVRAIIGG